MSSKNLVISDSDYNGVKIIHEGFSKDDIRQKYVQYAYKLGGFDFVKMIECENGNWNIKAVGDNGHAHGLCQAHDKFQKDIPEDYDVSWQRQIEYCYQKWSSGTVFYGPDRIIKGVKCSKYIESRFTFTE